MDTLIRFADVGIRVNLSSCETFADLMIAMERQLQLASQHAHFPFQTIIDEVCPKSHLQSRPVMQVGGVSTSAIPEATCWYSTYTYLYCVTNILIAMYSAYVCSPHLFP